MDVHPERRQDILCKTGQRGLDRAGQDRTGQDRMAAKIGKIAQIGTG